MILPGIQGDVLAYVASGGSDYYRPTIGLLTSYGWIAAGALTEAGSAKLAAHRQAKADDAIRRNVCANLQPWHREIMRTLAGGAAMTRDQMARARCADLAGLVDYDRARGFGLSALGRHVLTLIEPASAAA